MIYWCKLGHLKWLWRTSQSHPHCGLWLNLKKLVLKRELGFFGQIVSSERVATAPAKVASVREVRNFLGLASYYHCFVKVFKMGLQATTPLVVFGDVCLGGGASSRHGYYS